jgi:hypothetical protein
MTIAAVRVLVFLSLVTLAAPAVAWDLADLMRVLAANPGGRARFVETKTLALLDRPLVSSGELSFTPPSHLEKRTFKPKPESLVLDGDLLLIERGRRSYRLRLSEQPQVAAFVDSLRGTLTGDRAALEKRYKLTLSGSEKRWTLDLLPSDATIAAFVLRITFGGANGRVEWIRYLQADGDSALMTIEPVETQ